MIKKENKIGVELACKQAFKYLKNNIEEWDTIGTEQYYYQQIISMVFYNMVFKFGSNISGYCENGAEKSGTDDHWLSPRMGCYAIMNEKRELLDNYEEFREFFYLLRSTIKLNKSKNDSDEIKFVNDIKTGIVVKNLTIDKYDLIVNSWTYVEGEGRRKSIQDLDPKNGFPLRHLIPDFFTTEERKYYTETRNLEAFGV
tara:strand:+ start:1171 stop:1767 length:597 start_codon:yes stop_codon:yes gene_type:complete